LPAHDTRWINLFNVIHHKLLTTYICVLRTASHQRKFAQVYGMKEIAQNKNSLFAESVKNHQRLVNILADVRDKDNISHLSQPEMARLVGHSQTWVVQAIKRLNTEDTCIEMISSEKYVVHYTDILTQGVFSEIMKLIIDCCEDPELFKVKDSTIAKERCLNIKTVQMFKAYLRTGWKSNSL